MAERVRSRVHCGCNYVVGAGLSLFALCVAAAAASPPRAGTMAPEDIVRLLYADYMAGDKATPKDSAEDNIRPYASRALQKDIDEDDHCEKKSGDVCAIDSDFIIAGQDWGKLYDFHIDRSSTRNGLVLRVSFREKDMEPSHQVVTYSFVEEDGAWRIDDVHDGQVSLRQTIESYFKEYDENNNPRRKAK